MSDGTTVMDKPSQSRIDQFKGLFGFKSKAPIEQASQPNLNPIGLENATPPSSIVQSPELTTAGLGNAESDPNTTSDVTPPAPLPPEVKQEGSQDATVAPLDFSAPQVVDNPTVEVASAEVTPAPQPEEAPLDPNQKFINTVTTAYEELKASEKNKVASS